MLAGKGTLRDRSFHLGIEIQVTMQARTVGSDLFGDVTNPMIAFAMTLKLHRSFNNSFSVQFFKYYRYHSDCT